MKSIVNHRYKVIVSYECRMSLMVPSVIGLSNASTSFRLSSLSIIKLLYIDTSNFPSESISTASRHLWQIRRTNPPRFSSSQAPNSKPSVSNGSIRSWSPGDLQDGRHGDEDARGRVDAGEAHRQDLPADGQEQGRQAVARGVHRGRQERPLDCATVAVRPKRRRSVRPWRACGAGPPAARCKPEPAHTHVALPTVSHISHCRARERGNAGADDTDTL